MVSNLIQEKAYTMGINDVFLISTIVILIGLPLGFILNKSTSVNEAIKSDEITSLIN